MGSDLVRNGYALRGEDSGPFRYFDREGNGMPLMCWANMTNNDAYRCVAQTLFGPEERVSTIWLGLNSLPLVPPPGLIFETMVFAERSEMNQAQWRHASLDQAIEVHDMVSLALAMELKYV